MNRFFPALVLVFCISIQAYAQQPSLQYYYTQAGEAYQSGDYPRFYEMISEAGKIHPYHQGIMYQRGIAAARMNKPEEAIRFLREAILVNSQFNLLLPDLEPLSTLPDFQNLLRLQKEIALPVIQSDTAFVLRDRTLHAESIAGGEKGTVYISSIHKRKIVKFNLNFNEPVDFTSNPEIPAVFGIKVDSKRNMIWASASPVPEMERFDSTASGGVFKFDLKGNLIQKYALPKPGVLGDILISKNGVIYISDSENNTIYMVNEKSDLLEPFFSSTELWNIQGITLSGDEAYLFIADYVKGIFRLNTLTKELTLIKKVPDVSLKSIDGLIWYKHSLLAFQNGVAPMRATCYYLNDLQDTITDYRIIDRAHPAFNEPTNGCIVGDTLYYIANSQWGGYMKNHSPKPLDELQDVVILKADLKKIR